MKKLKKIILQIIFYTICWRNVDRHVYIRLNDGNYIELANFTRKEMRIVEDELKKIGIKLAKLAKKYGEEYIDLVYIDGRVHGFNNPVKGKHIDIYMDEKEVEKRCLKENI